MYLRQTSVDACGDLQVLPYRDGLTGLIIPVRKTCQLGLVRTVEGGGGEAPRRPVSTASTSSAKQSGRALPRTTSMGPFALCCRSRWSRNHQRAVFQPHVVLRPALLRQRPFSNLEPALRRTAFFFAFSLVFAFAARRRMAPRFHPTPSEMNVKRSFKPTAEKTENQRKT